MTEIASHRGGALLWAENSRLAFEQTAKLPVAQVEFDVHPSRDGRLVVIHDATLERTTDGAGALSAFLPQLSIIEAPYLWRDAAHMSKAAGTPLYAKLNDDLSSKRMSKLNAHVAQPAETHHANFLTFGDAPVTQG